MYLLKRKEDGFFGKLLANILHFHFDMSSSYHDASHKFGIHISTNVHRTNNYQIWKIGRNKGAKLILKKNGMGDRKKKV